MSRQELIQRLGEGVFPKLEALSIGLAVSVCDVVAVTEYYVDAVIVGGSICGYVVACDEVA